MKCIYNLVFITIFFLNFNLLKANELISYVDMNLLMNSSEAGKSITSQLTAIHKKTTTELKKTEEELKKEESDLIKQKNVISNEEFEKKLSLLRNKASDYQKQRKKFNDSINKKRLDATSELVSLIQPILAEYANNNSISIIFQKKNIIIGKTELDITEDVLKILNENHKKIVIN
jgi:outer membrane protein